MSLEDNRPQQYHRLQQVMQLLRRSEAGLCRSRNRLFKNQRVDAEEFAQSLCAGSAGTGQSQFFIRDKSPLRGIILDEFF